ncbi:hypothetical protein STEG23_037323, partial [Scotinomys teguina]
MSVVMLLPGTNGSLLHVQRTDTRTILLQESIGKDLPPVQKQNQITTTTKTPHLPFILPSGPLREAFPECKFNPVLQKFPMDFRRLKVTKLDSNRLEEKGDFLGENVESSQSLSCESTIEKGKSKEGFVPGEVRLDKQFRE